MTNYGQHWSCTALPVFQSLIASIYYNAESYARCNNAQPLLSAFCNVLKDSLTLSWFKSILGFSSYHPYCTAVCRDSSRADSLQLWPRASWACCPYWAASHTPTSRTIWSACARLPCRRPAHNDHAYDSGLINYYIITKGRRCLYIDCDRLHVGGHHWWRLTNGEKFQRLFPARIYAMRMRWNPETLSTALQVYQWLCQPGRRGLLLFIPV